MNPEKHFCAWPGWSHLRFAWFITTLVSAWFAFVYVGADWITAHRLTFFRIHLQSELQIPLVPAFTAFYMSIYVLFAMVPFVLRTRHAVLSLATVQSATILIAGGCFLLVPAKLAYPEPTDAELGIWRGLFQVADKINLTYNLAPSLHVALSVVCIEFFCPKATTLGRLALRLWGFLIAISTLLTHQHHVVDVVSGYLLAFGVVALTQSFFASKKMGTASKLSTPTSSYSA